MIQKVLTVNTRIPLTVERIFGVLSHFRCDRCGRCCREIPGIGLTKNDIERISDYLGASMEGMIVFEQDRPLLKSPCPFYKSDVGCTIHVVKPLACFLYPLVFREKAETIEIALSCDAATRLYEKLKDHPR